MSNEKVALLELHTPIYNGFGSSYSNPAVGIAHRKLVYNDKIIIRILKEDANGNRLFPYDYEISCKEALECPTMLLPDKVTPVHVVLMSRLTQILTQTPEPPITKGSFKDIVKKSQKVANRMSKLSQTEIDNIKLYTNALKKQEENK